MIDQTDVGQFRGAKVVDRDGSKVGKVDEIYLDDRTGRPEWALINTGLFGTSSSFVPLADAQAQGDDLQIPFDKAKVKDAPRLDADRHLDESEERELYRYYGMDYEGTDTDDGDRAGDRDRDTSGMAAGTTGTTGRDIDRDELRGTGTGTGDAAGTVGRDTSGRTTDDAMTRSEEQLHVGTRQQDAGRARMRKWVETDTETRTVPTSHEEIRVEREPITDANRGDAMDGPAISEEEHEVTLREEVPVVEKEAVPVERVRVDKETVRDEETVTEQVRKEQVGMEDDERRDRSDRPGV